MSIPKEKLHKLIEQIPDNYTERVANLITNYLEETKSKNLKEIYENPIKIKGEITIPSREERNE